MMSRRSLILVLLCLCSCLYSEAGIITIKESISFNSPRLWRYAVITPQDTPFGTEQPYLFMDFDLLQPGNVAPDSEIILFHHQNLKTKIGSECTGIYQKYCDWCCTQQMYIEGKCKDRNFLFIKDVTNWTSMNDKYLIDDSRTMFYWKNFNGYILDNNSNEANVIQKIMFNKTGIWYFLIAQCNSSHTVDINGNIEWKNPYGYLSGTLFPFLPMYVSISVAFLCLLIVWIIFVIKYRENLMGLQHVVTSAIVIAFAENVLWSYDYINYNINGIISDIINIIGALLTAGKFTIIRTCILLVALGYSITVPTLDRRTKVYVIVLTVIYGLDSALHEYIWVIRTMGVDFPFLLELIVGAVLVSANSCYVLWVGYLLFNHLKNLSTLKQTQKLEMYKKFTIFLVLFLTISAILFFLQTGLTLINRRDELWQLWWCWDAYWEFGYFFVVLLIAVLWWPNENNERYAYSVQIQADGEELEDIGLPEESEEEPSNAKLHIPVDSMDDIKGTKLDKNSDSDSSI